MLVPLVFTQHSMVKLDFPNSTIFAPKSTKFVVPLNFNALIIVGGLIDATAVLLLVNEKAVLLFETGVSNANGGSELYLFYFTIIRILIFVHRNLLTR